MHPSLDDPEFAMLAAKAFVIISTVAVGLSMASTIHLAWREGKAGAFCHAATSTFLGGTLQPFALHASDIGTPAEIARDIARFCRSGDSIHYFDVMQSADAPSTVQREAVNPGTSADADKATVQHLLRKLEILGVRITGSSSKDRLMSVLTTALGMRAVRAVSEALGSEACPPALRQPHFIIAQRGSELRVLCLAHIGLPVLGARPSEHTTPYILQVLSYDVNGGAGAVKKTLGVRCVPATPTSMQRILRGAGALRTELADFGFK
jgi:hypothetical protein